MGATASVLRVGLIEDHDLCREGLIALLSADERFDIAGTGASLTEYRDTQPWDADVLVADYRLPDGKGTELADEAGCPVLIISGATAHGVLDDAVRTGCAGFASKFQSVIELAEKIVVVANGGTVFPADAIRRVVDPPASAQFTPLTARERDVLEYLAEARSVQEISGALHLSQHTVRNHVRSILTKLHARSQLEAVVNAVRMGLLDLHSE